MASNGAISQVESIRIPDTDDPGQPVENLSLEDGQVSFEISSSLVLPEGEEGDEDGLFSIVAKLQAPEDENLNGDEEVEMKLLLAETGDPQFAISTFNSREDCFPGSIIEIKGSAECLEVGFNDEKEAAQFSFDVSRPVTADSQLYRYQLSAGGVTEGYEFKHSDIVAFNINGEKVKRASLLLAPMFNRRDLLKWKEMSLHLMLIFKC